MDGVKYIYIDSSTLRAKKYENFSYIGDVIENLKKYGLKSPFLGDFELRLKNKVVKRGWFRDVF